MKLNICLASDENYVRHMATTMVSILKNSNEDEEIIFHIIDGGISSVNKEKLLTLNEIKTFQIYFYTPDIDKYNKWFEKMKIKYHFSPAMFYRLSIPSLLTNIDAVLYLDSDIVVIKNISEIFSINISNYYAIVVDNSTEMRLNNKNYFCSGFMMINNKLWREHNLEDKFLEYYFNNYDKCPWGDQDILNHTLEGNVKYIENIWSLLASKKYNHENINMNNIITIHYLTSSKPWNRNITEDSILFIDKYWKYYQYTPWFKENITEAIDIMIDQKINLFNIKYNSLNNKYNSLIYSYNNLLHHLSWWIPMKKWRESFRSKFKIRLDET